MNNNEKPIANPFVVLREEFDDWAILFNLNTGHGFGLNPAGVFVWKLLDGKHAIDEVVEELCDHAKDVPDDAREHMRVFVHALVGEGLAAFDRTGYCTENSSPPGALSEVTPYTYEPPRLVYLNSEQAAHGATCGNGSHAKQLLQQGQFGNELLQQWDWRLWCAELYSLHPPGSCVYYDDSACACTGSCNNPPSCCCYGSCPVQECYPADHCFLGSGPFCC